MSTRLTAKQSELLSAMLIENIVLRNGTWFADSPDNAGDGTQEGHLDDFRALIADQLFGVNDATSMTEVLGYWPSTLSLRQNEMITNAITGMGKSNFDADNDFPNEVVYMQKQMIRQLKAVTTMTSVK